MKKISEDTQVSLVAEQLFTDHVNTVAIVVGRLVMKMPAHTDIQELHQVGLIGLWNAANNFDPNFGTSFSTYATIKIRGAVFDHLRNFDVIGRCAREKQRSFEEIQMELVEKTGCHVDNDTVIAVMRERGLIRSRSTEASIFTTIISLETVACNSDSTLEDMISDSSCKHPIEGIISRETESFLAEAIEALPKKSQKVIRLHYFGNYTLKGIADLYSITESRASQMLKAAIDELRSILRKLSVSFA